MKATLGSLVRFLLRGVISAALAIGSGWLLGALVGLILRGVLAVIGGLLFMILWIAAAVWLGCSPA